jgi:hypothetical protein
MKTSKGRQPWWASAVPKNGKRSTFEDRLAQQMNAKGLAYKYEPKDEHLGYMLEYIPDFVLPNGIIVEAKGWFDSTDRTKMLRVKQANPERDIRFCFMANNKINPKSKMRYSDWCEKHGFQWCLKEIPEEWWNEQ